MKKSIFTPLLAAACFLLFVFTIAPVVAKSPLTFPTAGPESIWTTVLSGKGSIEGLTGDDHGRFYVADRVTDTCNVWEIDTNVSPASVTLVGQINATGCRPSGLTFGPDGALYITSPSQIYRLVPDAGSPPSATLYAEGVPGANGLAFLRDDLYVTDGTQNQGRVWKIQPCGSPPCAAVEFFRIQPRLNGEDLGGNVLNATIAGGVGSARFTVPRFSTVCNDDGIDNGDCLYQDRQDIVANGIAFTPDGRTAYVADTARGAIWAAKLNKNGDLISAQGCDPTFNANVLCMDSLYVAHPLLEGADGIALLKNGTILVDANERNAIVAVFPDKTVKDVFQNAPNADFLRNGDGSNARPLETPTSPFISGKTFCTTNGEFPRRDNYPPGPGEGHKVNCLLDYNVKPGGLPLPVQ